MRGATLRDYKIRNYSTIDLNEFSEDEYKDLSKGQIGKKLKMSS